MTNENEILERINEIATALAEERVRTEERTKNMMEKIERALSHAHDAKNTANAFAVRIEIMEKDIRDVNACIDNFKAEGEAENRQKKGNRASLIIGTIQAVTSAIIIWLLIFIWEHIYNK